MDQGKVLVVTGARQVGKSTLVREMLSDIPDSEKLILNLDDPFLRDRLTSTEGALNGEIEHKAQRPWSTIPKFHLVIDEAQKAPALFESIKALHDEEGSRIRIALTGSSALEIHDPVAETLAGRSRLIHLEPFTLSEGFAHSRGEDPTGDPLVEFVSRLLSGKFAESDWKELCERSRWDISARKTWVDQHLRHPLYPEPSTSATPEAWVTDYLATYLEKDIQSLASVGNVSLFRACLRQLAARTGSTLKWETMAQEVGTTSVTLRKYVGLLEQTFTLIRLGPFAVNPVKRVTKAPKAFLLDPGLLWGLRGFEDLRLLRASGMLGAYMELLAIVEIAKWCSLEPTGPELRFWRKTDVSEVDLIVSNRGYHIPIEVKLGTRFERSWTRGFDAFEVDHRSLGLEIPYRVILYRGEPAVVDERTYALPIWALV